MVAVLPSIPTKFNGPIQVSKLTWPNSSRTRVATLCHRASMIPPGKNRPGWGDEALECKTNYSQRYQQLLITPTWPDAVRGFPMQNSHDLTAFGLSDPPPAHSGWVSLAKTSHARTH